jgi:hypothetical protein
MSLSDWRDRSLLFNVAVIRDHQFKLRLVIHTTYIYCQHLRLLVRSRRCEFSPSVVSCFERQRCRLRERALATG